MPTENLIEEELPRSIEVQIRHRHQSPANHKEFGVENISEIRETPCQPFGKRGPNIESGGVASTSEIRKCFTRYGISVSISSQAALLRQPHQSRT
jgi:hypothetical protein